MAQATYQAWRKQSTRQGACEAQGMAQAKHKAWRKQSRMHGAKQSTRHGTREAGVTALNAAILPSVQAAWVERSSQSILVL
eukprot:363952-Chlamydomonas_euryale.AAC.7